VAAADPCPAEFLDIAARMADAAGDVVRPYFRAGIAIDDKPDDSPVTVADRDAEAAMRAVLAEAAPDHGIYGEEHGVERLDAEFVWVLDPIDGTKSFVSGVPLFGTLIALLRGGEPILGVIDQPVLRERWVGARGRGTALNGSPVHTRACGELHQAILFSTTPDMFPGADMDAYDRVRRAVRIQRFGGDCYAAGLLASGHIDLHIEGSMQPYDYLALVPVIEEAGGLMTDWQGNRLGLDSDGRTLGAGDARMHAAARELLNT